MHLARYHDITISASGVWRILHKLGLGRLPTSQRYKRTQTRWKRYEKQRPGHQLQVDVKFIEPLGQTAKRKRYYQYTAIDEYTRIRGLRAYERNNQKTAIQFLDHVLAKLPFQIERVQTDNGAGFGQAFHWHLLDKSFDHVKIRPRTTRLNGKVERSHRIHSDEFYGLLEGEVLRHPPVRRTTPTMGRPLQVRSAPRRPRRPRPPTNASNRTQRPHCHRRPSVAHESTSRVETFCPHFAHERSRTSPYAADRDGAKSAESRGILIRLDRQRTPGQSS
ncbi:DDE-type integrase/transposase/recombinase [Microbacterium yannicii]|uniref:DDE-type integrase/transposase/recombinase n=1 Tax=Microbacterium yannicii TaxID=671622 RepID=UPI003C6D0A38